MSETYKATNKVMTPFGMMENHSTHPNAMRGNKTFKDFISGVDEKVNAAIGVSIHDLPDHNFREYWFDDCATNEYDFNGAVETCASDVLYDNGFGEN
jgi:hypothetical protein